VQRERSLHFPVTQTNPVMVTQNHHGTYQRGESESMPAKAELAKKSL